VFEILRSMVRGQGAAALIATHNLELASRMDRILTLRQGRIVPV
jgi:lipoprotein-releasing system ATP-binding protein